MTVSELFKSVKADSQEKKLLIHHLALIRYRKTLELLDGDV